MSTQLSASQLLISVAIIGTSVLVYGVCVRLAIVGRMSRRAVVAIGGVSTGVAMLLAGTICHVSIEIILIPSILGGAAIAAGIHAGLGALISTDDEEAATSTEKTPDSCAKVNDR